MTKIMEFVLLLILAAAATTTVSPTIAGEGGGESWVLQKGRDVRSRADKMPELIIEGQNLSGTTGCNGFTATLTELSGKRVSIDQVATTRKLCGPSEGDTENALLRAFSETQFLSRSGTHLTFLSGKRQAILVWARKGPDAQPGAKKLGFRSPKVYTPARHRKKITARIRSPKRAVYAANLFPWCYSTSWRLGTPRAGKRSQRPRLTRS